jgi:hypothetical protein
MIVQRSEKLEDNGKQKSEFHFFYSIGVHSVTHINSYSKFVPK